MPFWSRKGKEKARDQDTIVPRSRSSDSIDSELAKPEYQKATPDEKPNLTRQKLVAYWETEEERLSQIALKVEEAQGKCSPAYMAATEAADEVSMHIQGPRRELNGNSC